MNGARMIERWLRSTRWITRFRAALCICMTVPLAAVAGAQEIAPPIEKPNIVLIIGDDQGYRDFGFMGSEHAKTPNLDRLASEGLLLTNGQSTSSICRPALRSLLTGFHPFQWNARVSSLKKSGVRKDDSRYIENFLTLPGLLQKVGYRSFQGGKIFEQDHRVAGFTHGAQIEVTPQGTFGEAIRIGRHTMEPVFEFIDQQGDEPFFLWFAPMLPHTPHNSPARFSEPFEGKGYSDSAVAYYASILRFDESVGQLVEHLEKRNLRKQTLIVYVTDNGWDQGPYEEREDANRDGPHGKMTLYETGTRTPILFNWPGRIPAGGKRDEIVSIVDLFPTLLGYAGVQAPKDRPGRNMRPLLDGKGEWTRRNVIGWMERVRSNDYRPRSMPPQNPQYREPAYFYRDARWRFIWNQAWGSMELYDMQQDPEEKTNVAVLHRDATNRYLADIKRWRVLMAHQILGDQLPTVGQAAPKKMIQGKRLRPQ